MHISTHMHVFILVQTYARAYTHTCLLTRAQARACTPKTKMHSLTHSASGTYTYTQAHV